jgi:glycolate oxidase iron-sulfur subunit
VDTRKMLSCIHCGFCLPTCPTYVVTGNEADSPRGRIYFMRGMQEGRIEPTEQVRTHLDRCLTCFACETACPSGVEYRELIQDTRSWLNIQAPASTPPGWHWFFTRVLPSARRLRWSLFPLWLADQLGIREFALKVARKVPVPWLGRSTAFLPARIPSPFSPAPLAEILPARGERKMRVGYLLGCVMEGMLPAINRMQVEILRELGCEVVIPAAQGCCGALGAHEGERALAQSLGNRLVAAFAGVGELDAVIASAAGCGSTMKDYAHLLLENPGARAFAAKVRDFTEVAAPLAAQRPPTRRLELKLAYQEACHLGHAQRVTSPPRALLRAIPGVTLAELPEQELCCGSAGVYNMLQPEISGALRERKAGHAAAAGVDAVVTANPGCLLQLAAGLKDRPGAPRLYHLAEVLAMGYGLPTVAPRQPAH